MALKIASPIVVGALTLLCVGCTKNTATDEPVVAAAAAAQERPATGFSFAVYGDSRPMMYLPVKQGQPELTTSGILLPSDEIKN